MHHISQAKLNLTSTKKEWRDVAEKRQLNTTIVNAGKLIPTKTEHECHVVLDKGLLNTLLLLFSMTAYYYGRTME